MWTYRVNFNDSLESIFGEARDGCEEIPCGAYNAMSGKIQVRRDK